MAKGKNKCNKSPATYYTTPMQEKESPEELVMSCYSSLKIVHIVERRKNRSMESFRVNQ